MSGPLHGQVAVVTGGSRGIGAATAHTLAAAGATVIVTHRDSAAAANDVIATLPGSGHRAVQASVTDSASLAALADDIAKTEGRLDILVNNAGWSRVIAHGDLAALDDETFDHIMKTNVRGAFACVRAVGDLLAAGDGGVIVNLSSVAAHIHFGSNIAYCASKAAIESMTMTLARALAPKVRVVAVAPGVVDTDFTRAWDPAVRAAQIAATPLQRFATPEEVGNAILAAIVHFPHTTGAIFPIDGGRPLGT
ncbi:MAG: SDR family NAD(P)-dependent oxidoreductase [Proteobacteria bacterium]|nr:SDR family NAD(P)-dependent oxidoreductase [Pseudomonadota bacterium]MDA1059773.1 SDR family NAD(P)-dependent oxidoreductase [Pseudomonadota bacterium]